MDSFAVQSAQANAYPALPGSSLSTAHAGSLNLFLCLQTASHGDWRNERRAQTSWPAPNPSQQHHVFPSKYVSPTTLCPCTSQYIWLTWWTLHTAKLISFWVHSSHGDHLLSASNPIWSKHYPREADNRISCIGLLRTCALCIYASSSPKNLQY